MKITVITDERGNVIGTVGKPTSIKPEAGTGGPVAGPGQSIREVEVPKELQGVEDVTELHRRLADHLGK
ncbi:MAG TPA: hypothetical protein VED43_02765 [Mycobacterium sp.]|nr:hypothetical protein [Mycobacterium sp.]